MFNYILMSPVSYFLIMEPQLKLFAHMEIVYYYESAYLLKHRSEHRYASTIYYQIDIITKAMYYKAKHAINLKPDSTKQDAGDLILLVNFPNHGQWFLYQKTDHFFWNTLPGSH